MLVEAAGSVGRMRVENYLRPTTWRRGIKRAQVAVAHSILGRDLPHAAAQPPYLRGAPVARLRLSLVPQARQPEPNWGVPRVNRARCVVDGVTYTALDFSRLAAARVENLRRDLVCVSCDARAFFRHRSRDGRAACFGSNDHRLACPDATDRVSQSALADEAPLSGVDVIRINVAPDSSAPPRSRTPAAASEGPGRGGGAVTRSLRTLLRHILTEPAFLYSEARIRAAGLLDLPARTFFVRFEQITSQHVDQDRGYWGTVISYGWGKPRGSPRPEQARDRRSGSDDGEQRLESQTGRDLWLNAGPPREPSVLVAHTYVAEFLDLHHLVSPEDVVGSHLLVLGRCAQSSRGKSFIRPESPRHMTFLS